MIKTPEDKKPTFIVSLSIVGLCILFGANAVAVKISLTGFGTFTTAGVRFLMASVAIAIWAKFTRRSLKLNKNQLDKLLFISGLFICQISLFYLGMNYTLASRASLLANVQPFFVLVLAHFFIHGDQITWRKFIGIVLGFTGVVIMFMQKDGMAADIRTGDFLILASVAIWAINAVYTKKVLSDFRPFQLVLYQGIVSVPFLFLAAYIWDEPMITKINLPIIFSLLYQGLVTASLGFVIWISLLKKHGAVTLHSYIFLMPVSGVLLSGIMLGEPIGTYSMLFALFFIVAGILAVNYSRPLNCKKIK